jgi:ABC-type branched-subunit amino acid transport system ATPase component
MDQRLKMSSLQEQPLLVCRNVSKYFGALAAINDLSIEVVRGEVLGISGPNGAGKTTLFDVISGLSPADSGEIIFEGTNISGWTPDQVCHRGISRTFQFNAGFDTLTVRENVLVAAYYGNSNRALPGLRFDRNSKRRADEALEIVGMTDKREIVVKDLPVFYRKLLMVAGVLATGPKLLLMDEPVGGLNQQEMDIVMGLVERVREQGVTTIIIEHVMRFLIQVADRALVMHHGKRIYEGSTGGLCRDKMVVSWSAISARGPLIDWKTFSRRLRLMADVLLELKDVTSGYEGLEILRNISLRIHENSVVTIIGPNGHGKTTLLRTISGLIQPIRGSIWFAGKLLKGLRVDQIVSRGVVHIPQGDLIFPEMTVRDNLLMGAYLPEANAQADRRLEQIFELLPTLQERRNQTASTLSGGERRMLSIGRGLMTGGRIMLIDEPSLGLAPIVIDHIYEVIDDLKKEGRTILIVEENASRAADLSESMYLLDNGRFSWQGHPDEIEKHPEILETYLGG